MHQDHHLSLRPMHEAVDQKAIHWGLFIGPVVGLFVVAYFYLNACVDSQSTWLILFKPSMKQNKIIYYIAIACVGVAGLLAILTSGWNKDNVWYWYLGLCGLFMLYLFLQELTTKIRLVLAAACMLGMAFISAWISRHTASKSDDVLTVVHKQVMGAIVAWSIIYAVISWLEFLKMALDCGDLKLWTILFFIIALVALAAVFYWLHESKNIAIGDLIAYIGVSIALYILLIMEARSNGAIFC